MFKSVRLSRGHTGFFAILSQENCTIKKHQAHFELGAFAFMKLERDLGF
jgi:hypothetical protein